MNSNHLYDAIVVGAGPAGSVAATFLSRAGMDVLIAERGNFPREKICGCCLNPGCWRLLEQLGVDEAVRSAPSTTIDGIRIIPQSGKALSKIHDPDFFDGVTAIRRSALDEILLANAVAAGASTLPETRIIGVNADDQQVTLSGTNSDGPVTLRSRYVIGADGRNSVIAASGKSGTGSQPGRFGLQWFAINQPALRNNVLLVLLPFGYVGIVNVDPDTSNVALVVDAKRCSTEYRKLPDELMKRFESHVSLRDLVSDLTPHSGFLTTSPIDPRRNDSSHRRIVLAGDARLTVEPFTGEGIAFALRSGADAAAKILNRVHNRAHTLSSSHSDFRVNRVYSPILSRPRLAETAIWLLRSSPFLFEVVLRSVLRPGSRTRELPLISHQEVVHN